MYRLGNGLRFSISTLGNLSEKERELYQKLVIALQPSFLQVQDISGKLVSLPHIPYE
jgi:hypothetical protein